MDAQKIKKDPEIKSKNCNCFRSGKAKVLIVAAIAIGVIILMLGSFAGGVKVGFRKAKFSSDWGKNYERNFMGPRPGEMGPGGDRGGMMGMMRDFEGRDFRNAHGLAGTIVSIADNNIIVKDKDGKENTVAVTEKTLIKSRQTDLKIGDLKADDQIVVMGSPNESGVVDAVLIRVFNN
jgi:hypothetical protein